MYWVDFVFVGIVVGCIYALYGLGLTVVYKATRVPNFAQGAIGTVSAFVFYKLWGGSGVREALKNHSGFYFRIPFLGGHFSWAGFSYQPPRSPIWVAFLVSLVVAALLGLIFARVMRPFARAGTVTLMIVSFGLLTVVLGLAYNWFSGYNTQVHHLVKAHTVFSLGSLHVSTEQLMIVSVTVVLAVALAAFFRFTHTGVTLRSVADDREVSQLLGINVRRTSDVSWVLGSLLAAVAGILLTPLVSLDLAALTGLIVVGFIASLFGGFRSLVGTLAGGILLGIIQQLVIASPISKWSWMPPLQDTVAVVVIVALLMLRPRWIFSGIRVDEDSGVGGAAVTFGGQSPAEDRIRGWLRSNAVLWVALRDWRIARWVLGGGLAVFLLVFPVYSRGYWSTVLATGVIFSLVALSIIILTGWAGQVSLAQYAFVGLGAYTTALLSGTHHLNYLIVVPLTVLISVPFSLVIGFPSLRLRGFFLALVTLAFAVAIDTDLFLAPGVVRRNSVNWTLHSGAIHRPFNYSSQVFYLSLAVALICFYVAYNLKRSRTGRAMLAIRDSEPTAIAFGINPTKYKLLAFCISGAVAAAAGSVYGYLFINMSPINFLFIFGVTFIGYGVLTGIGELIGAVLVGFLFAVLPQLTAQPVNGSNQTTPIVTGLLLIWTVFSYPQGMGGFLKRLVRPDDETRLILTAGEFSTVTGQAKGEVVGVDPLDPITEADEEAVWAAADVIDVAEVSP
jgi:sulfate-transporting ATPase